MLNTLQKSGLATLFLLSSLSSHASFKTIQIDHFEGQYNSPQGYGSADAFKLPDEVESSFPASANIEIFKGNGNFQFSVNEDDYLWEDAPKLFLEMESAQWSGINFNTTSDQFSHSLNSLNAFSPDKALTLSKANAACRFKEDGHSDFVENLLEACLNGTAQLRMRSFNYESRSGLRGDALLPQMIHIFQGFDDKSPGPKQKLEDIQLDIQNNSFEARLKTKVVFNTTVKMEGRTYYESKNKLIGIRIDKAKAGFLNVKDRVFEELETRQNENLRVDRPWVYYQID